MSIINKLEISQFRNIHSAHLSPGPRINLIYGKNGSGKTSLLEAAYYLSLGRSFRTQAVQRVIQHETAQFSIFAKVDDVSLGMEKTLEGNSRIRLEGKSAGSVAELAKKLPIQLINPDAYCLLNDGPKFRREFLDWGVFHVEHRFLKAWRDAQRALKQRNLSLKNRLSPSQIRLWDQPLAEASELISAMRLAYLAEFTPLFLNTLAELLEIKEVQLRYLPGWDLNISLLDALAAGLEEDRRSGHTQSGPHRADIELLVEGNFAKDTLSRGQQKLFVYAMRLAQGRLFTEHTGQNCVYLIDDLAAELDDERRAKVLTILDKMNVQVFITSVDKKAVPELLHTQEIKLFHVEHGVFFEEESGENELLNKLLQQEKIC